MDHTRLAPCPDSPNCVSSLAPADDAEHHVEPIAYTGPVSDALAAIETALGAMKRTRIQTRDDGAGYLHAVATSALFRFKDDVEFLVDQDAGVIHVRSASRVGHSDLGVNRRRVEGLRAALSRAG